jgi:hypothetical protein
MGDALKMVSPRHAADYASKRKHERELIKVKLRKHVFLLKVNCLKRPIHTERARGAVRRPRKK